MQLQQQMMMQQQQMAQPAPTNLPTPIAIGFELSVPLPDGRETPVTVYFSGEQYPTPQHVQMVAAQIGQMWPIKSFQPRNNGWGGGGRRGGGGGYGGGGYGGGGGWR